MATLAEIRAKLKAQDAKTSSGGPIGDNAILPTLEHSRRY